MQYFEKQGNALIFRQDGETVRVEPWQKDSLRAVSYTHLKDNDEEADYFLEEFAHACIDAGASAVIGGGTHQLKGIELYRDCLIFYCLGNFIFENQYVRLLPADYMEKYGQDLF